MRVFTTVLLIAFSFACSAKDFNNGCGSGWNEKFVPDRIRLLGINFVQACSNHDNCYSKCLEGGVNYGKPICDQTAKEQKEGRRAICDSTFLADMQLSCKQSDPLRKAVCSGVSALYEIAVKKAGGGSFNGMEVPKEYFDFIVSDAANSFDFTNFVNEVNQIQNLNGISSNNKLRISIEGNRPQVQFISTTNTSPSSAKIGNLYRTDSLKYGSVDLTKATIGNKPLTIQNIEVKKLDLQKLTNEQRFSTVKP